MNAIDNAEIEKLRARISNLEDNQRVRENQYQAQIKFNLKLTEELRSLSANIQSQKEK